MVRASNLTCPSNGSPATILLPDITLLDWNVTMDDSEISDEPLEWNEDDEALERAINNFDEFELITWWGDPPPYSRMG